MAGSEEAGRERLLKNDRDWNRSSKKAGSEEAGRERQACEKRKQTI